MFVAVPAIAQRGYSVRPLGGINKSYAHTVSPAFYKDGIIFSSNDKLGVLVTTTDADGEAPFNLYYAVIEKGKAKKIELLDNNITSADYSDSWPFVTRDGSTLYFASNRTNKGKFTDQGSGDESKNAIYSSNLNGDTWGFPREIGLSDTFDVSFPTLNPEGNVLFFAAKNPEGFGGFDIYMSEKKGNGWGNPVNLGDKINTPENEVSPFYHPSGRLYFSSRGHNIKRGLDVFYTEKINGEWIRPVILGKSINSAADEYGFILNATLDTGYMVRRTRSKPAQTYITYSKFPNFAECPNQIEEKFCYEFYEESAMELDTTQMYYEWDFGDGNKKRKIKANHCFDEPGEYEINLNVLDRITGDVYFSEASYILNVEPIEQPYMLVPDTAKVGEEVIFNGEAHTIRSFKAENFYWNFGDGNLADDIEAENTFQKEGVYYVKYGITGEDENGDEQKQCALKPIVIIK